MKKTFEDVLDDARDATGWDEKSALLVLLNYLDSHCVDKVDHFEEFTRAIVKLELEENNT